MPRFEQHSWQLGVEILLAHSSDRQLAGAQLRRAKIRINFTSALSLVRFQNYHCRTAFPQLAHSRLPSVTT
ncbi:MAG: hypothetical protein WA209_13460, partial [Candidatus Acidiferrales bacterium]